jgi:hypothetical protein
MWEKLKYYIKMSLARRQLDWVCKYGSVEDRVIMMACFYIFVRDEHKFSEKELSDLEARAMNFIGTYGGREHIQLWNLILADTTKNWKKQ